MVKRVVKQANNTSHVCSAGLIGILSLSMFANKHASARAFQKADVSRVRSQLEHASALNGAITRADSISRKRKKLLDASAAARSHKNRQHNRLNRVHPRQITTARHGSKACMGDGVHC